MPNRHKILFVSYGGGHARMLRPVIETLVFDGRFEVVIMALTSSRGEFQGLNCRITGYKDFFEGPEIRRLGEMLISGVPNVIDYDESLAYLGQNFLELSSTLGRDEAMSRYEISGRQCFFPVESMSRVLQLENPDLVVSTNSPRSERAALVAAGKLGIKSMALVDMFAIRGLDWFRRNDFSDRICVLSEAVKSSLVAAGRDPDSIVVTGNPAFDSLVNQYQSQKYEIDARREASKYSVLWASQVEPAYSDYAAKHGDPELPITIENKLEEIFSRHRDWQLVVRNHPNETIRVYPDFVEVSTQQEKIADLLARIDVVITLTSTLGFQGSIFGAGFVTIDLSVLTETLPFSRLGMSRGIDSLDRLEDVLVDFSKTPRVADASQYFINDATQRVVGEICSILNISRKTSSCV